jgi:hypothetical protein
MKLQFKLSKYHFLLLFFIAASFFFAPKAFANTCTVTANASPQNWSATGTWSGCSGIVPTAQDDVILNASSSSLIVDVGSSVLNWYTFWGQCYNCFSCKWFYGCHFCRHDYLDGKFTIEPSNRGYYYSDK